MSHHDGPWRRLPALAPLGVALALTATLGFIHLLMLPAAHPPARKPLELAIVDVPPPAPPPVPSVPAPPAPVEPSPPPLAPEKVPVAPAPVDKPAPKPVAPSKPVTRHLVRKRRVHKPRPVPHRKPRQPVAVPPRESPKVTKAPVAAPSPSSMAKPTAGDSIGARAIFKPMPQIPDALRRHPIDTVAVVAFHVATDGSDTVELRQATSDPRLNAVLLDGFRRWRFFPAMQHNRPVASTVVLRVPIKVAP